VNRIPEYDVIRTNRSTADIVVERDGSIVVRAPGWVDDAQVRDIVEEKLGWIYRALAEWRDLNAARVLREFKPGEGFLYLGRAYRLQLVSDEAGTGLSLRNGRFCLSRRLIEQGDPARAKAAFQAFYEIKGSARLPARVSYFAPKVGVRARSVAVRELGNRWASCSPAGDIAFHWRCMMAPPTIIDYLVVHELCHFHYRDHTQAFWNEVDKVMPSYRERKAWLRRSGAALDL
jgi:predicted metal-dependent hydrolase